MIWLLIFLLASALVSAVFLLGFRLGSDGWLAELYRIDQLKLTEPRPRCGYRHSAASFTTSASGSDPLTAASVFKLAA